MSTSMSESSGTNRRRTRSTAWEHYKRTKNSNKAECLYCRAIIGCSTSQGTSAMRNHLGGCKEFPYSNVEKRQKSVSGQLGGVGSSRSFGPWKFDQETSRKDLAAMFIISELPFKFVENEAFQQFVSRIQLKFSIPSRNTLREDCYKLYLEERCKLKKYFGSPRLNCSIRGCIHTGGRVLDVFRSSLTPSMVEALICAQDWLRSAPLSLSIEEDLEELEIFESELSTVTAELNSILVSLDD